MALALYHRSQHNDQVNRLLGHRTLGTAEFLSALSEEVCFRASSCHKGDMPPWKNEEDVMAYSSQDGFLDPYT